MAALALVLGLACSGFGLGGSHPADIKIGIDLPLSGDEGRAAKPALNGIRYYVQQHPTLDGFNVALVVADDSIDGVAEPPRGAANVEAFVADPQVIAVIGPFDSSVARAEIPVANQASMAMVSPATSSPCLTKDTYLPAGLSPVRTAISCKDAGLPAASELRPSGVNNYFRLATSDELQGPAAADYAFNTLHLLRVGVISDHEAYGQSLASGFEARFARLGGSIVGRLDLDPTGKVDPPAFLNRVKADGAQAIFYGGVTANKGCVIRSEMAPIFGAAPLLGGDGIADDPQCLADAGANATGIFATIPTVDPSSVPSALRVIDGFRSMFPSPADYSPYTVIAYDAAAILYDAVDRAIKAADGHIPPRGNVISQLSATQGFAGATGRLGFDVSGDSTLRVVSVLESPAAGPDAPWTHAATIDYSTTLPY